MARKLVLWKPKMIYLQIQLISFLKNEGDKTCSLVNDRQVVRGLDFLEFYLPGLGIKTNQKGDHSSRPKWDTQIIALHA